MLKTITVLLIVFSLPGRAFAWGEKGHTLINRLAIEAAANQLPEFMTAGRNQLIYDANEPDRWREELNTPLSVAQAPDHFFDSEMWGSILTIEGDRFAFMEKLPGRKIELVKIGYLPYSIVEMYGRLRNAFRQWRNAKTPEDREAARLNALVYAGTLGHYVGDGSNPMHLSIHYDGWDLKAPNPSGYRTRKGLHAQFESAYVNEAVRINDVQSKVESPQRLPNVWESIKSYLNDTFRNIETLYALEKAGEFDPSAPKTKGTQFVDIQLARAATMLANLWYTAWLESAEPAVSRPQ